MTWELTPDPDEPTALAYTPDHSTFVERMLGLGVVVSDTRETTVALAVESARRWARRTDLSPELRLRRMWQVLTTALEA